MNGNENTMQIIEKDSEGKYMQQESDITQLSVWKEPCENLNEETDRSMSLIDSTARDLHFYMRGMFRANMENATMNLDSDKVLTAVQVARGINELIKTKLEAIKTYQTLSGETEEEVE